MVQLNPNIKKILEKIDFIKRYRDLSMEYHFNLDESFERYENKQVLLIFNELGYKASFHKSHNFFKVEHEESPYKFQFNFVLKYGAAEFIWAVWKNEEFFTGDNWGGIKRSLDGLIDDNVRLPIFRNYDELKEILRVALHMYEDFKREFLAIYSNQQ